MTRIATLYAAAAAGLLALVAAAPAWAATDAKTWVAGNGSDANTASLCSRTAPCKTFSAALGVTSPGGLISCLDPSYNLGQVVINQEVTIDCSATSATIYANGEPAIVIATFGKVTLRGLTMYNNANNGEPVGISIVLAGVVEVQKCKIFGFDSAGIFMAPINNGKLRVSDTVLEHNGRGIMIDPPNNGFAFVVLDNVTMTGNVNEGLRATGQDGGGVQVSVRRSVASYNGSHGFAAVTVAGGQPVVMKIDTSESSFNNGDGVRAFGATVSLGSSTVMGNNGTGLDALGGGNITSYGDNINSDNTVNGAPTNTLPLQ